MASIGSNTGIPGTTVTAEGGKHALTIDLDIAKSAGEKISVQDNVIHLDRGTYTVSVTTKGTSKDEQGRLSADIESVTIQGIPATDQYAGKGAVSASFGAELNAMPAQGANIVSSLAEKPDAQSMAAFERAAAEKGYAIDSVAYAMKVDKSNLEDGTDVGTATVTMTVSPAWVLANGGISGIHIARLADDGTSGILATSFNGLDANSNMIFTGSSPGGLSMFALISVQGPEQVNASQPVTANTSRADTSAPLIFIPPTLMFAAYFLFRKN